MLSERKGRLALEEPSLSEWMELPIATSRSALLEQEARICEKLFGYLCCYVDCRSVAILMFVLSWEWGHRIDYQFGGLGMDTEGGAGTRGLRCLCVSCEPPD